MMRVVIGVDPGFHGALVVLTADEAMVYDAPLASAPRGHNEYDKLGMVALLHGALRIADGGTVYAALEATWGAPGQGRTTLTRAARGGALWEGMLAACGIETVVVQPTVWKRTFGLLHTDKRTSLALARHRFPALEQDLRRQRDHGRAEALLIALWGRGYFGFDEDGVR